MAVPPFNAVLFDLDGTLIDTAPDFIRIVRLLCTQDGVEPPAADAIRMQVSEGARAMVRLIYPNLALDGPKLLALRDRFLALYSQQIAVDTALFPEMSALLEQLQADGVPWGIVTNKPRGLSESLLSALGLAERCSVLVCPDDVAQPKPNPEPMHQAADRLGQPAAGMVYVGDHPRDIEAGRAAGMVTVLAAYGYLPPEHCDDLVSWGADYVVDSVAELRALLYP